MKTVTHKTKELTLESDAFYDWNGADTYYSAYARDEYDNRYLVRWEILDTYREHMSNEEDVGEDEACDWNAYTVKAL